MNGSRCAFIFLLTMAVALPIYGRDINFASVPKNLQLYSRDSQDSCAVDICGVVQTPGYDSIRVVIYKNEQFWRSLSQPLIYVQDSASFSFAPKIHAELSDYQFEIFLDDSLQTRINHVVCGDAFLIEGQSNAVASGDYHFGDRWVRTFGTMSTNPTECFGDTIWDIAIATPLPMGHADVGIWGMHMGHLIVENYGIPICIINGAQGGTHITWHLKDEHHPYNLNTIYGRHLYRTTKAGVRDKIKAVLWHQGEADTWMVWARTYEQNFDTIYEDWLIDYPAIEKVYLWQLRHSFYCGDAQPQIREIQRQIALNADNIKIMATANLIGHDGLHYNAAGYEQMGDWIYPLVARDYYGLTDTLYITPPEIQEIYYTSASNDTIAMLFDQPVIWPDEPYWGEVMEDYIFLDGVPGYVLRGYTNPQNENEILLVLSQSVEASLLSYTADAYYRAHWELYEGPWIVNRRGIGALIFYEFPVQSFHEYCQSLPTQTGTAPSLNSSAVSISASPNPFNPATAISYQLSADSHVKLRVFDTVGRLVTTLVNGWREAGSHEVTWDASGLPSGLYFCRMQAGDWQGTGKMVLMK